MEEEPAGTRLSLAQLVRLAREEAGYRQVDAAEAVGVHKNTWQNWEKGEGAPELHVQEIEEALGLEPGWFATHRDPFAQMSRIAEDVASTRRLVEKLAKKLL
jgi:transcriptional regulator with XRE-family HTH domain